MKFQVTIPTKAICPNHNAPFDFVYDAFMELESLIVVLGNRTSGKTLNFAILLILNALANDDCEEANLGAIETQAMRCYGYIKRFLEKSAEFMETVRGKTTLGKTEFKNNSWIQVLVATMAGVNSPHPQRLFMDEVELINWTILQEALSMPVSKDHIRSVTVLGSTRKFAHGPMQRLIDDDQARLFQWCIWEVMEAWPEDRATQDFIRQGIIDKFGSLDILPANLFQMDGFYKWHDLLDKMKSLDEETFRTQWMCERPDSSGLIFPKFDDLLNTEPHFQLDKSKDIYIFEDIGYAKDHPDAILFCQIDMVRMEVIVFDELYLHYMIDQAIVIEVIKKLSEHGLCEVSQTQDLESLHNYAEYFTNIRGWIPDYHPLTLVANRKQLGLPILDKVTIEEHERASELYLVENGTAYVRSFIDDRRMKITPNVKALRNELHVYSRKRLADGTYSDQIGKKDDHGCFCPHTDILTQRGTLPIIEVTTQDKVWTPLGWSQVLQIQNMGKKEVINFHATKATKDHPLLTQDGFLPLRDLKETDKLWSVSISSDYPTDVTQIHQSFPIKSIFAVVKRRMEVVQEDCILMYGNSVTGKSQRVSMFITKTAIMIETILKILKYTLLPIIIKSIQNLLSGWVRNIKATLNLLDKKLLIGINQKQVNLCINGSEKNLGNEGKRSYIFVSTARKATKPISVFDQSSAVSIAKCQCSGSVQVHNLVTDTGMFTANSVVVSNCDALRYGIIRLWYLQYYGSFGKDLGVKDTTNIIHGGGITSGLWDKKF